jgi:hypothetical protein
LTGGTYDDQAQAIKGIVLRALERLEAGCVATVQANDFTRAAELEFQVILCAWHDQARAVDDTYRHESQVIAIGVQH